MFEGFRVLSMWWVLALEMLLIYLGLNLKNIQIAYWIVNLYIYALIRSATFAFEVIVFLMVVTNFISLKSYFKEHKGINIVDYAYLIFRRLLKLAPIYLVIFLALWTFTPYLSDAPGWFTNENAFT